MQHNWIFQLKDQITKTQREQMLKDLVVLMREWKAHGAPVPGEAEIHYDRFIVVKAIPGNTTGCSIDSMNHGVDQILTKNGAELLPNNYVFFRNEEGALDYIDFREIKPAIQAGDMGPETTIYDNTMGQENDLNRWEVRLVDSWLSRFLPKATKASLN